MLKRGGRPTIAKIVNDRFVFVFPPGQLGVFHSRLFAALAVLPMVGLTAYSRLAASVALIDIAGPLGLLSAVEASFDLEQNVSPRQC